MFHSFGTVQSKTSRTGWNLMNGQGNLTRQDAKGFSKTVTGDAATDRHQLFGKSEDLRRCVDSISSWDESAVIRKSGYVRSRSLRMGSAIGHSIPKAESFHRIPIAAASGT